MRASGNVTRAARIGIAGESKGLNIDGLKAQNEANSACLLLLASHNIKIMYIIHVAVRQKGREKANAVKAILDARILLTDIEDFARSAAQKSLEVSRENVKNVGRRL